MSNLSISNQPAAVQFLRAEQTSAGVTSSATHTSVPAKDFVAQVAQQPGSITALLSGQSLMAHYSDDKVVLAEPSEGSEEIDAEQQRALVSLSDNLKRSADDHKLDQLAASASTLFTSQINTLQANVKSEENSIKTNDLHRDSFVNVVGDMNMLATLSAVTKTLNQAEAIGMQSSALASQCAVDSATRAGTKGIDAAIQRRTGSINSGLVGLAGHTATSGISIKALRNEKMSINNNLKQANKLEKSLGEHRNAIKSAENQLVQKGKGMDKNVQNAMTASHPDAEYNIANHRAEHSKVQNNTQRKRIMAEYGNQTINSAQNSIEKSLDVAAANESKQADMARANQTVNNELSNTHTQTAKKAHDSRASIEQAIEGALNSNSNAGSAIAGTR